MLTSQRLKSDFFSRRELPLFKKMLWKAVFECEVWCLRLQRKKTQLISSPSEICRKFPLFLVKCAINSKLRVSISVWLLFVLFSWKSNKVVKFHTWAEEVRHILKMIYISVKEKKKKTLRKRSNEKTCKFVQFYMW